LYEREIQNYYTTINELFDSIYETFLSLFTGELRGGIPPQWWGMDSAANFSIISDCYANQLSHLQVRVLNSKYLVFHSVC